MFDWLFEGRTTVYVILAAVAVVCTAVWARNGFVLFREHKQGQKSSAAPQRRLAVLPIVISVMLLLMGGYFILDRLVETRNEQIDRKLHEMARAVAARNADRIFEHISEQFRIQEIDRATFRRLVDGVIQRGEITELVLWDVKFPDDSGNVTFQVKPQGSVFKGEFFFIRARFVRDNDGQWRLQTFAVFGPAGGEIPIPQI